MRLTNSDLEENVNMSATGSGQFNLLVDSTDISTGAVDAFALTFGGSATSGDVTISNQNNFTAGDARALFIDTTGSPTVRMLVQDSVFSNSSAQSAAEILGGNTSVSNVTVQGNTFTNTGAGDEFTATSSDNAQYNLNLGGTGADKNTATGAGDFVLTENGASAFGVLDKTNTYNNTRNNGNVTPNPNAAIGDLGTDPSAVPLPNFP
jgi:hypothetical protein